jgi:hypothetical protein
MQSNLADQSTLFVYCDGPKNSATSKELQAVEETRKVVHSAKWCKETIIIQRRENHGLANSVMSGVSEVLKEYQTVIVLEDDMITSPVFLDYMNSALNRYKNSDYVGAVNAWSYPLKCLPPFYFLHGTSCWGWGTWRDRWELLVPDLSELSIKLNRHPNLLEILEEDAVSLFRATVEGECDSWWIRWHISLCLNNMLGLFPAVPFIYNIGLDGTGTNCGKAPKKQKIKVSQKFVLKNLDSAMLRDSPRIEKKIRLYKQSYHGSLTQKVFSRLMANFM